MSSIEQVTIIALFGSIILFVHLLFHIGLYCYKSWSKPEFWYCVNILLADLECFYIYLFYSGLLTHVPWLRGYTVLNLYLAMISYYAYIEISLTGIIRFSKYWIIPFAILSVHILVYLIHGNNYSGGFDQLLDDYTRYSVPGGFPTIQYMSFSILSPLIAVIFILFFLAQVNQGDVYSSQNVMSIKSKIDNVRLVFYTQNSAIRYFLRLLVFPLLILSGYGACSLIGGRQWAVYYTSAQIILMIFGFILPEIYPFLIKAKIIKPVSQLFHSHNDFESEEQIRQKIISVMEKEKPWLDEDFRLESLSKILGIRRNLTSTIINRYFNCTFIELLHEYRICEAKKILENNSEVKSSMTGFEVGYKSVSAFYSTFHKETGISPQHYRSKFRK